MYKFIYKVVVFRTVKKLKSQKIKVLVVTETPPELEWFWIDARKLLSNFEPTVIFTDSDFKDYGKNKGYIFGHVPHRGRKYFLQFALGKIPEWRGYFSKNGF